VERELKEPLEWCRWVQGREHSKTFTTYQRDKNLNQKMRLNWVSVQGTMGIWGQIIPYWGQASVLCSVECLAHHWSSPPDSSSSPTPLHRHSHCDNQKCLKIWPNSTWRARLTLVVNYWAWARLEWGVSRNTDPIWTWQRKKYNQSCEGETGDKEWRLNLIVPSKGRKQKSVLALS
jgi:hypothetical protein